MINKKSIPAEDFDFTTIKQGDYVRVRWATGEVTWKLVGRIYEKSFTSPDPLARPVFFYRHNGRAVKGIARIIQVAVKGR